MALSPRMQRILMYYALVKLLTEPRVVQQIRAGGGSKTIRSLSELGVKDHDLLDGLLDDDHTQYPLLLGRAGGQHLYGGTASGDDLTLESTSHATKGDIIFGSDLMGGDLAGGVSAYNFGSPSNFVKTAYISGVRFITCVGGATDSTLASRNALNSTIAFKARVTEVALIDDNGGVPEFGISRASDISFLDAKFPIFDKASGNGIKVDTTIPTFGWRDLLGKIRTRGVGGTDPNDAVYNGNIKAYQFSVNDECWVDYHIPHDYVKGTDIYLHFHWSHNNALVTGGTVTWGADITYAKGHNQAAFPASVNTTVVGNASTTQYQHIITEIKISASAPGASEIDTDDLEPDGVIMIRGYLSANNITVSGGGVPDPFLHFKDIHYQSTNIATKDKVPDFYT